MNSVYWKITQKTSQIALEKRADNSVIQYKKNNLLLAMIYYTYLQRLL